MTVTQRDSKANRRPYPKPKQIWMRLDKRWKTSKEYRVLEVNEEEQYVELEPLQISRGQKSDTRVSMRIFRNKYDFVLHVDSSRIFKFADATGIPVRAIGKEDRWGTWDIAQLDRDSFIYFMQREQYLTQWVRNVFYGLFGYERESKDGE